MKVEVKVVSRDTIKPSSPTPHHLRKFSLSLLDQMTPSVYTPVVLYYATSDEIHANDHPHKAKKTIASRLKHSLSETLTHFYQLGGRIRDNLYIECNDEGASFSEAQVMDYTLSDFLQNPDLELLDKFLPCHTICTVPEDVAVQVAVQVNVFACGGVAVGISLLHKIIDGTLISSFIRKWAAVSRGRSTIAEDDAHEYALASTLFPPQESLPACALMWSGSPFIGKVKSSAGRYVFNAVAIETLKARATSKDVPNPTIVEALSGFIWTCLVSTSSAVQLGNNPQAQSGNKPKPSVLAHAVNLRLRMDPRLPRHSVGNIVWKAFSRYDPTETKPSLPDMVSILRKSIVGINSDYVKKLQGNEGFREISKWLEEVGEMYSKGEPESYSFTSWRKMGLNGVDFGWGRPTWVSPGCVVNAAFKNGVLLMESPSSKDEVEAWMILDEQEMRILEKDPEFLAFASVNPSISLQRNITRDVPYCGVGFRM